MTGAMCDDNRFELIEKYKNKLIDGTNIETSKIEMAVIDNILFRFWQMGWLDKLEEFDRQKAEIERLNKAGEEAVSCFTRMESLYKIKCKELEVAKSEAIKKFAESLLKKELESEYFSNIAFQALNFDTNNLLKEMVGE